MSSTAQKGHGRQEPASCQSCRAKKLRCNRAQPCSNCTARGISCTFLVPPHKHKDAATHGQPAHGQSNAELLQRLERLEALVSQSQTSTTNGDTSPPSSNARQARQLSEFTNAGPAIGTFADRDQDSTYVETLGTTSGPTVFNPLLVIRPQALTQP